MKTRRIAQQKRPATRTRSARRKAHRLDATDRQILAMLQENARTPNTEISKRIGMVPSGVFERIRRLERAGVIQGYEARIDPAVLGLSLIAFVFIRAEQPKAGRDVTPDRLAKMPEVHEIHHVAGEDCFLIKVRTSDNVALGRLLREITRIPAVRSTRTTIVLGTDKDTQRMNVGAAQE